MGSVYGLKWKKFSPSVLLSSADLPWTLGIMLASWSSTHQEMGSLSTLLPRCHSETPCSLNMASYYHSRHFPETKQGHKHPFKHGLCPCFGKSTAFSLFNSYLCLELSKCSLTSLRLFAQKYSGITVLYDNSLKMT